MLQEKFVELRKELNSALLERADEVLGLLIALIARVHVFLLGPPGTAKSHMIRSLASIVDGADYFERLLTRFTTPDEIFGAVKLSALKQDRYERAIEGHLPTAHFGFLDEIWKANSAILNSLLTLINERIYHNNGSAVDCPLETLLAASNELPEDRAVLGAMWDRFLIRFLVRPIQEDSSFAALIGSQLGEISTRLDLAEIHQAQDEAAAVAIPAAVLEAVVLIRSRLRSEGIQPSDRRYAGIMSAVQAHAWIHGRSAATTDDLEVLRWSLWDEPEHRPVVDRVVLEVSNPLQRQADELFDGILSAWRAVEESDEADRVAAASEATAKINTARKGLDRLLATMRTDGRNVQRTTDYIDRAECLVKEKILRDILGIG